MWKLNIPLTANGSEKQITREITKYLETNENKPTTYQNI